jgi:hypothetical protein
VAIEVKVTDRRAAEDFAVCMRELTEVGPSASGSYLSTHFPGTL